VRFFPALPECDQRSQRDGVQYISTVPSPPLNDCTSFTCGKRYDYTGGGIVLISIGPRGLILNYLPAKYSTSRFFKIKQGTDRPQGGTPCPVIGGDRNPRSDLDPLCL
jgi:hypothetical protein